MESVDATLNAEPQTPKSQADRVDHVRAVERALQLIGVFARARGPHAITGLAAELDLPTTTVHRLVQTLTALDYVTQYPKSKRYGPGRGITELSHSMTLKFEYAQYVQPYLEHLVETTGETASLAALYGTSVIYLNQVESPALMRVSYPVGTLVPLHCTAAGKVYLADFDAALLKATLEHTGLTAFTSHTITKQNALLAELARVRKNDFAIDDEEHVADARCIAVGIRGSSGAVVSTISIAGPKTRIGDEQLPELARIVSEITHQFAEAMREF